MRLNSKLTWGLAWAGLAVVVAVPSLDFFTGKSAKTAAVLESTTNLAKTAAVTTTVTPSGITITPTGAPTDPVNSYLKTNKTLPSYITDGTESASPAPTQVANIDPAPVVAPVPFPARPADTIAPPANGPATPTPTTAVLPAPASASSSLPYVIDDQPASAPQVATAAPAGPIPPEPIVDDSSQWHTKSLEKYLDQNGLMDSGTQSTANLTVVNQSDSDYDPNGFYLSDGPNNPNAQRRKRILRMLEQQSIDDGDSGGFSLF